MYEVLDPRPTEPDAAVVRTPDSVTQFVCPASLHHQTHHINVKGQCVYCRESRITLAKRYGFIR